MWKVILAYLVFGLAGVLVAAVDDWGTGCSFRRWMAGLSSGYNLLVGVVHLVVWLLGFQQRNLLTALLALLYPVAVPVVAGLGLFFEQCHPEGLFAVLMVNLVLGIFASLHNCCVVACGCCSDDEFHHAMSHPGSGAATARASASVMV